MARPRAADELPGTDVSKLAVGLDSVVEGSLHLIVGSNGSAELFDTADDPQERENLAAQRPADVARLRSILHAPR